MSSGTLFSPLLQTIVAFFLLSISNSNSSAAFYFFSLFICLKCLPSRSISWEVCCCCCCCMSHCDSSSLISHTINALFFSAPFPAFSLLLLHYFVMMITHTHTHCTAFTSFEWPVHLSLEWLAVLFHRSPFHTFLSLSICDVEVVYVLMLCMYVHLLSGCLCVSFPSINSRIVVSLSLDDTLHESICTQMMMGMHHSVKCVCVCL